VEFITTLIAAMTAGSALAAAAFRRVAEHRWLAGISLLGVYLLQSLHAHAPCKRGPDILGLHAA
jgi:hypothetical protein